MFDKVLLVTRRTRMSELLERYHTRGQARFALERAGTDWADLEAEDDAFRRALDALQGALHALCPAPVQVLDRALVPTYLFGPRELVLTLGQDGLVANVARYALGRPLAAFNPEPSRFDGTLLPFTPERAEPVLRALLEGRFVAREVTLAEARLSDGQRLLAFNELFLGARTHVSARYRLEHGYRGEEQSSSGVLVSTGAGSTGWLRSAFAMAEGLASAFGKAPELRAPAMRWEDPRLCFVVREPFPSKRTRATLVGGMLEPGASLRLCSRMASGGVLFSDGVESDFVSFHAGVTATVRAAPERAKLVVAAR